MTGASAIDRFHLRNDFIKTIEMKARQGHRPVAKFLIDKNNPALPIAIDLVDDISKRLVAEHKRAALPGGDLFRIGRCNGGQGLSAVTNLLVGAKRHFLAPASDV